MHQTVANKRAELAALCQRFGVRRLEVFGSAARGADFDIDLSDADFLVEFNRVSDFDPLREFLGFRAALTQLLDRPVDLVEPAAVTNPYVREDIDKARLLIYAA